MPTLRQLTRAFVLALSLMGTYVGSGLHAAETGLRVATREGIVQGTAVGDIRIFKGIPYAAPPVGKLRWKPPEPPPKWTGARDATRFAPPCPYFDTRRLTPGSRLSGLGYDIFMNVPPAPGASEDCLHLNIWTPERARRAAVMVWIQPLGPSSYPLWDGSAFARDGIVLVTIDYRQFTLGNFAHPALAKEAQHGEPLGRFQTMDQIAALRWVKQNIEAFGGDPGNVTLFGESAGGASVLQIMTIPAARGLFDKAIVESGNGWWSPFDESEMESVGIWMARQAGLPGKSATPKQLRTLGPEAMPWLAVYSIDGRLQKESATVAIEHSRIADVPLMIGWNDFDGSSLRYDFDAVLKRTPKKVMDSYTQDRMSGKALAYQLYTDSHDGAPARWIAQKTASGAPTYLYLFSYVRTANRGKVRGASHGEELPYVFDSWKKAFPRIELSQADQAATRILHSCWVSFAKTSTPSCEGTPAWPRYTRSNDRLMELGSTARIRQHFRAAQLDAQEASMWSLIHRTADDVKSLLKRLDARSVGHAP